MLQRVMFVVDETPYACWDWDLKAKNLEFLQGIDPNFFEYTARVHAAQLDGRDSLRAALAIRLAYSQALETLFALSCAAIQAPQCVVGWMASYRTRELINLVRKVNEHRVTYSCLTSVTSWASLSSLVHRYLPYDSDKKRWIADGFAGAWRRWAQEFTKELPSEEYNGIKHGLRVAPGGFALAFGLETSPGIAAPPDAMELIGESEFGTSFFRRQRITDRMNFRPARVCRNWDPVNLANGLYLLSMSILNVTSFLRIVNGDPADKCQFQNPQEPAAFDEPWNRAVGVEDVTLDSVLSSRDIRPCLKEDVLRSYERKP